LLAQYNHFAFVGEVTFHKILKYQYGHYTLYLQKYHTSWPKYIKNISSFISKEQTVRSRKQGGNSKKLPHPRPYQFRAISML